MRNGESMLRALICNLFHERSGYLCQDCWRKLRHPWDAPELRRQYPKVIYREVSGIEREMHAERNEVEELESLYSSEGK